MINRFLPVFIIVVCDQLSKLWAVKALLGNPSITVFTGFDFSLAYNKGAAFSFLSNAGGWQNAFFIGLTLLVSAYLVYQIIKFTISERQTMIAFVFILGGAIGNLIDRIRLGYVVDFIDWYIKHWHWPTFNIADSAICIGVALMIAELFGWSWLNKVSSQQQDG